MSLREEFIAGRGCPLIDMHGHLGPFRGIYLPEASLEAMVAGMDRAGVERIVLSPHSAILGDTREGNREMLEAVRAYPGRVYGYCTINPNWPDEIPGELDRYLTEPGVLGVKLHPGTHDHPLDGPGYALALERLNERRGLLLSHTWGRDGHCGTVAARAVAERYPEIRFLLGHSCYGAWEEAIALAAAFPNVYLELTAVPHVYGILEWMCRDAGASKVVFGTDYPWFDYGAYVGFVTWAHLDDDAMRLILYGNGRRLIDEQLAAR